MQFQDYHRTIVGYHGTRLSVAEEIVTRKADFRPSQNPYDWLGEGIYFWEYAPEQAYAWAKRLQKRHNWNEPIAILGSMIRLGFCLDFLDPYNVRELQRLYEQYIQDQALLKKPVPKNFNQQKYLDCAVLEYAYSSFESSKDGQKIDSVRAVHVPKGQRIWKSSWISFDSHIQICIRNPTCILGTWLHRTEEDYHAP